MTAATKLRIHDLPQRFRTEEEKLEYLLKGQLGPISWALHFSRLLEVRGVWRVPGPKGRTQAHKLGTEEAKGLLSGGISPTVGLIAEELGVPRSTAFRRLQWARDLADHPTLIEAVDRGEMSPRAALSSIGVRPRATKPDLGNGISHPARFSEALIELFAEVLEGRARKILDPFAGPGGIHDLQDYGFKTIGVELEPEWAEKHPDTQVGDALELEFDDKTFDAIVTSPTFGNRFADHHNARDASTRRSYTHDLGRPLSPNNSGKLHWGEAYRVFHHDAWFEAIRVLKPRGLFVLNIKDHIRNGKRQYVGGWHVCDLVAHWGMELLFHEEVEASGMRAGANSDLRCPEYVYVFERPKDLVLEED